LRFFFDVQQTNFTDIEMTVRKGDNMELLQQGAFLSRKAKS
jgi:hypothetical protein